MVRCFSVSRCVDLSDRSVSQYWPVIQGKKWCWSLFELCQNDDMCSLEMACYGWMQPGPVTWVYKVSCTWTAEYISSVFLWAQWEKIVSTKSWVIAPCNVWKKHFEKGHDCSVLLSCMRKAFHLIKNSNVHVCRSFGVVCLFFLTVITFVHQHISFVQDFHCKFFS